MSKIVKVLLLCTYIILITQYIISFIMSKTHEEVIDIKYILEISPHEYKNEHRKIKQAKAKRGYVNVTIVTDIPKRLPTDLKNILLFTNDAVLKSPFVKEGQDEFINANCKHINCFITSDKRLLVGLQYFDALLFNVESYWYNHPTVRSPHQKYVFVASEPAQEYPICQKYLDDFYNLTWTYKLDSDLSWPYLTIYDKNGTVVGPKINMTWQNAMDTIPEEVKKKLDKKSKVAAWFVSSCDTISQRGDMFEKLEVEFRKFNMSIDTFGSCAKKQCSKDRMGDCLELVERDYYFYLAFERAMCEDYVTETVVHALLHYAVPIVYGGANYTRFLPPGSYINADEETPESLAALVIDAMQNRDTYENYFRWHSHYVYKHSHAVGDVCTLCEILNRPRAGRTVKNLRKWWHPGYTSLFHHCRLFY